MKLLVLIVAILFIGTVVAYAKPKSPKINDEAAILSIIGEAENQDPTGMFAVACAIRNRGSLIGVYGMFSNRVKKGLYSDQAYQDAKVAWKISRYYKDITNGATGWGNAKDLEHFKVTNWWKACRVVFTYKDHFFYKENRV